MTVLCCNMLFSLKQMKKIWLCMDLQLEMEEVCEYTVHIIVDILLCCSQQLDASFLKMFVELFSQKLSMRFHILVDTHHCSELCSEWDSLSIKNCIIVCTTCLENIDSLSLADFANANTFYHNPTHL